MDVPDDLAPNNVGLASSFLPNRLPEVAFELPNAGAAPFTSSFTAEVPKGFAELASDFLSPILKLKAPVFRPSALFVLLPKENPGLLLSFFAEKLKVEAG